VLVAALADAGIEARAPLPDEVLARGTTPAAVGHVAFAAGVELHGLARAQSDLETIFLQLVDGADASPSGLPPAVPTSAESTSAESTSLEPREVSR